MMEGIGKMRIRELKEFLSSFNDDTEIYITTTPNDLFSPLTNSKIKVISANLDEQHKYLNREKIVFIAYNEEIWGKQ